MVNPGEDPEADCVEDHVVEVGHHEVGVAHVNIDRHGGQHHAGDPGEDEVKQATQAEQHRSVQAQIALPERSEPGEHLHSGGNGDQHRGEHEDMAHPVRRAGIEHVVGPHDQAEEGDAEGGDRHESIAEQWLAGIDREEFGEDAEHRQHQHVHSWVGIEPEEVLKQHRITAAFRPEKAGAEAEVEQQHHRTSGEGRQPHQLDGLGGPSGPDKHRHLEKAHAGRPHPDDRRHEIDGTHDRGDARQGHSKDPEEFTIDEVPQRVLQTHRWV